MALTQAANGGDPRTEPSEAAGRFPQVRTLWGMGIGISKDFKVEQRDGQICYLERPRWHPCRRYLGREMDLQVFATQSVQEMKGTCTREGQQQGKDVFENYLGNRILKMGHRWVPDFGWVEGTQEEKQFGECSGEIN